MIPNKSVFITKKSLPSVPVGTPIQIVLHEQENYYALWSIGSGKGKKKEYRRRMVGWIDGNISHEEFCEYFEKVEYPLVKGQEKIYYFVLSEGVEFPLQKFAGLAEANRMKKQELSDLLIKQQFIEKWDGKLPTYSEVPSIMKSIQ